MESRPAPLLLTAFFLDITPNIERPTGILTRPYTGWHRQMYLRHRIHVTRQAFTGYCSVNILPKFTLTVSPVTSKKKNAFNTGSRCEKQLYVSIRTLICKREGNWEGAYQGTTLNWTPKPFMTAEQSGFGTEVTAHTYQADNLIF